MDSIHLQVGRSQTVKTDLYAGNCSHSSSQYQLARSLLQALVKYVEDLMKKLEIHSLNVKKDSSVPMLVVSPSRAQVMSA